MNFESKQEICFYIFVNYIFRENWSIKIEYLNIYNACSLGNTIFIYIVVE